MESRKSQLQKQIVEALKANDNELYSLLKSQWAHRFGVESLEELNNLDLKQLNQNTANVDDQKIDKLQENFIQSEKSISIKNHDNQEKEIKASLNEPIKDESDGMLGNKSYEIIEKEKYKNEVITTVKDIKIQTEFEALIPLPPKPKYSYLNKWLLRR